VGFIGGGLRQEFVTRIKDADPGRLLAVPIDVGKRSAAAMVCDFWGEIIIPPFDFPLNENGFQDFSVAMARAEAQKDATWTRVGIESAGHYHQPLQARLESNGIEVTVFNPAQVKENRNQDLLRSLKSDAIDLAAMAELLIRGKGRISMRAPDAVAIQGALALHRTRKIRSRSSLKNQIHSHLDLVFPGLTDALWNPIESKAGRIMLDEGLTPQRVRRMGPERLLRFCSTRGVRVTRIKAAEIVAAARVAFALPETMSAVRLRILMADMELLAKLDQEVLETEEQLAEILPETPADILTTLPRVSVVRASNYGGAVGDITRFRHAGQVYRLSGLVPRRYESAGKIWTTTKISREGKVELREAILELGKALRQGHPNFARYADSLKSRGKPGGVIQCAIGQRANRLAFAMMRDQTPFDPFRW